MGITNANSKVVFGLCLYIYSVNFWKLYTIFCCYHKTLIDCLYYPCISEDISSLLMAES